MTKFSFSYADAIKTLSVYHSIPAGAEVEILAYDPAAANGPFYSTTFRDFYNLINGYRNTQQRISAIKEMRQVAGIGLKEAKDLMDDFWNTSDTYEEFVRVLKKHNLPASP